MGLKLMGARHFLDMSSGTIYQRFWENDEEELLKIIDDFNKNKLEINWNDIEIYGDNYGSAAIEYDEEYDDYIYYYDANVVGDANPFKTLYLVIDEDKLPSNVEINGVNFTKNEIVNLKERFLMILKEEQSFINRNEWARQYLEQPECRSNYFINLIIEK